MKLITPLDEIPLLKSRAPVSFECEHCSKLFTRPKNYACRAINGTKNPINYCSNQCSKAPRSTTLIEKSCQKCKKIFVSNRIDERKYCSRSCASKRPMSDKQKKRLSVAQTGKPFKGQRTPIKTFFCKQCSKPFEAKIWSTRVHCSKECSRKSASDRCKAIPGMCRNNNRHAGWYESPIAGRVWLESSWEVKCAQLLDKHNIKWCRPKSGFEWFDVLDRQHKYYPDFYLEAQNLYLDPKNPFAQTRDAYKINDVRKRHDIRLLILDKKDLEESRFLALINGGL